MLFIYIYDSALFIPRKQMTFFEEILEMLSCQGCVSNTYVRDNDHVVYSNQPMSVIKIVYYKPLTLLNMDEHPFHLFLRRKGN